MTVDGIQAVQARMAELRALVSTPATTTTSTTGTAGTTATGTDFASTLAAVTGSAPEPTQGATAQSLLAAAEKYVGTPYVWGGESLDEGGLDCSGLVLRSLADIGVTDVPRVARDQQRLGTAVPSLDQALPGDLLVFGGGTHIAIYEGDGKMIDAPKPGGKVGIRDVWGTPTAIRRILPQESSADLAAQLRSVLGASGTSSASVSSLSQRAQLDLLTSLGTTKVAS
ncbi:C40 family peptidase [Cellulomonas sp.]|uniref:C40 family peptidase n=1 Tax=Cellulomonas sp. TaxID=40001 RepID=UPI001B2512DF|nr:C40 family peptidase [Cellulomonas sp.]MBO9553084.1 C40 family peptidase [Cellulomonas sp.]